MSKNSGLIAVQPVPNLEKASDRARRPVYRVSLKDWEGFPTVVVAGPHRERVWLYGHGPSTPTVLRLHRPVVRFLVDALADVAGWFDQPPDDRGTVVWTLPRGGVDYPECVVLASYRRAWLHVYAMAPSMLRLNERIVEFLREAVADLPAADISGAVRSVSERADLAPPAAWLDLAVAE